MSISDIKLFDPFNPTDASKFSTIPGSSHTKLDRFQPMRETASGPPPMFRSGFGRQDTEGFGERWEERICQLSYNAKGLFSLNPTIDMSENCIRRKGEWIASTTQAADLIITNGDENADDDDEEFSKQSFKKSIVSDMGSTESQYRNLAKIMELKDSDGNIIKYGGIAKKGMLGSKGANSSAEVRLIKIVTPVPHFTMALYYPNEDRVEFWDSGGSWGSVAYDRDGNPYSATLARRQQTRSAYGECLGSNDEAEFDKDDLAVCKTFKTLLGSEINFVAMNTRDLQIADADAYCQTWVLLYTYMRFIYPIMSTVECMEFFKSLDEDTLLVLIESWAEYLIYFDTEKEMTSDFRRNYSALIGGEGDRKRQGGGSVNQLYQNIYDFKTKRHYSINSKMGKQILNKYISNLKN